MSSNGLNLTWFEDDAHLKLIHKNMQDIKIKLNNKIKIAFKISDHLVKVLIHIPIKTLTH